MASDEQRKDCWNKALYAHGTAYIFEQRLKSYRRKLRVLTFLGLAVPVAVGGVVVAFFGIETIRPALSWLIVGAAVLSTIQLVATVWALVAKWDDKAAYASTAASQNRRLSSQFGELAQQNPPDFDTRYQLISVSDSLQRETDIQQEVSDKEERMGLRAGLRQLRRKCVQCGEIPTDMKPTTCRICGNF